MSHADTADDLLIKPTAGARPASPRTLGRFIRKARTRGPTPDESRTPRTTPGWQRPLTDRLTKSHRRLSCRGRRRRVNADRRYSVDLTEDQALVLYRYLFELEEEQKLDPAAPAFDPSVHRALEIVYFALEDQLPRVDDRAAFERAREVLRREFREYWEPRLPPPAAE